MTIFWSLQGGKFHFPQPVLDKFLRFFMKKIFKGGDEQDKLLKNQKGGVEKMVVDRGLNRGGG